MPVTIQETNFTLPGQIGEAYHGKVGDVYTIDHDAGELLAVVRTDRISAFNAHLHEAVPHKGQVLNQMSAELLAATVEVAPNWLINTPDPNVSLGYKADPIKVEMIVRGCLLGSAWKMYKEGGRDLCGNRLPEGMEEFQPFPRLLITPTTKTETDDNITPDEIVATGLATAKEYDQMTDMVLDLFEEGQAIAARSGLYLADTKFEFGRLATGQLVVIDEALTPDSSRYLELNQYLAYSAGQTDERPQQLSKEFVREWLKAQGFDGQAGAEVPHMPPDFVDEVSRRYVGLFERMMGFTFEPVEAAKEADRLDIMSENITRALEHLTA